MIKIITLKTELPSGFLKYALAETDLGLELRIAEPTDRAGLNWQINHPDLFLTSDKFVAAGFIRNRGGSLLINGASGNFPTYRKHAETKHLTPSKDVGLETAAMYFMRVFDDRKIVIVDDGHMSSVEMYLTIKP